MKGDKTSIIALTAAALILLVVGAKSYHDYVEAKLEKKYAGQAPPEADPVPPPQAAGTPETPLAAAAADASEEALSMDRLPRSVLPPIPAEILSEPPPLADPARQIELDALRRETALYEDKLNQLRSGGAGQPAATTVPSTPHSALGSALGLEEPLVGPVTGAVPPPSFPPEPGQPRASPDPRSPVQADDEIAALAEQIRRQPAIAKVLEYDAEWAILVLSGGAENNITPEMRLAVRRGSEILGFIKVTEVEERQSVAELMSHNKHSPTARKPQPGDDVIAFNLF